MLVKTVYSFQGQFKITGLLPCGVKQTPTPLDATAQLVSASDVMPTDR